MVDGNLRKIGAAKRVVIILLGIFWMAILYHTPIFLSIIGLKFFNPLSTSFMRFNSLIHPTEKIEYEWRNIEEISDYLENAVVIAEDDRFYQHSGYDIKAIRKAFRKNWKRKSFDFGASTISQQLAKNLYLYPFKDPFRKIRELALAVFMDLYLSKERILELYLNLVEFGPGIYGAEAAADYYFNGSAKNLGPSASAFLASILPNPRDYGKRGYRINGRAKSILNRIK